MKELWLALGIAAFLWVVMAEGSMHHMSGEVEGHCATSLTEAADEGE